MALVGLSSLSGDCSCALFVSMPLLYPELSVDDIHDPAIIDSQPSQIGI